MDSTKRKSWLRKIYDTQSVGQEYGFMHLSFAKRMKEICVELFPELMAQDKNSARWVYQTFGTDYCRRIKNNVWVDILLKQLEDSELGLEWIKPDRVVVDDVRFYNEYFALRNRGFKMVRIHRSDNLRAKFGYNVKDTHSSEIQLDSIPIKDWDLVIINNFDYPFREATKIILAHFGVK